MSDQRITGERRANNRNILDRLHERIEQVHDRVYNGLAKEIRAEVKIEIDKVNSKLWVLLSSLFVALIAIVVTVLLSTAGRSAENERNYKAILDIGYRVERLEKP